MKKRSWNKGLALLAVFCLVLTLLPTTALAADPTTEYVAFARTSFESTDGLVWSGDAVLDSANARFRLVIPQYNQNNKTGGLFTAEKVSMDSSGFSMAASIWCGGWMNERGNGVALVLAKNSQSCTSSAGDGLGYVGMPTSTAVEYFTFGTAGTNDIGLGADGVSASTTSSSGVTTPVGGYVYFWVDYDAAATTLYLYMSLSSTRPASPTATYTVDLGDYTDYYIGFTAATGTAAQEYSVSQWYYNDTYVSASLKLDGSVNYVARSAVNTLAATDVTDTSATLCGEWGTDYASGYTKGFEYKIGTDGAASEVSAGTDETAALSGLQVNTTYYYRAYAVNESDDTDIVYGIWKTFKTLDVYTLTVSGGYFGSDPSSTTVTAYEGDSVTVTAFDVSGSYFIGWTDGDSKALSQDNPYTFTPSQSITLTPNYIDGFSGSGTGSDPYRITDEADLDRLASLVDAGYDFAGCSFILTQDITLSGDFNPIGTILGNDYPKDERQGNLAFSGTFDGNGKTIYGLTVSGSDRDESGLFAYVDDAEIKNLTVSGAVISSVYYADAGVIVGMMGDYCTVTDCRVIGNQVSAAYDAGAIAGYAGAYTTVSGCEVMDCTITTSPEEDSACAAGIIGEVSGNNSISNCTISGSTITGRNAAGGVAGWLMNSYNNISGCTVTDCTIESAGKTGGVAGETGSHLTLTDCKVSGGSVSVNGTGTAYAGGAVGFLDGFNTTVDVENCTATCSVSATGGASSNNVVYAGGIAGYGYASGLTVKDCEYNGSASASATACAAYAGGIVGCSSNYNSSYAGTVITNCVAYGSVASGSGVDIAAYAGGIVGRSTDAVSPQFSNNVAMQSSVTGVYANSLCAGCSVAPTVSDNYASGSMTLSGDGAGGTDGTEALLSNIDSAFWTGLGFIPANSWKQTTADNVTAAAVEAHQIALYIVTFDANGGVAVESQTAFDGDSISLPTTMRSGYVFSGWSDGSHTYAAGAGYTVTEDVTLTARWTAVSSGSSTTNDYTITASAGEGGSISPSGSVSVAAGTDETFMITADSGYQISDVLVDGVSAGPVATYTFADVSAAHTIEAVFVSGWVNPFEDVSADNWFYNAVKYVHETGLMNGTAQNRFEPGSELTRAMLVTILYRLDNEPSVNSETLFDDVASGNWYSDAVAWAAANGIVGGYGDGTFGPADSITREQIAVLLFNYAEYKGYDLTPANDLSAFSDAGSTSFWAQASMKWAVGNGLLSGKGNDTLDPTGTATRAEIATILMRFIETYID